MECNRVPPANNWQHYSEQQVQDFRSHIRICSRCRKKVFAQAPDELLFELRSTPGLPEDFWLGFWDSLEKKLPLQQPGVRESFFPILRWAAVFILCCLLVLSYQDLSESPSSSKGGSPTTRPYIISDLEPTAYPLVEQVENPRATYYIFQPMDGQEKIVLLFDPDLEL